MRGVAFVFASATIFVSTAALCAETGRTWSEDCSSSNCYQNRRCCVLRLSEPGDLIIQSGGDGGYAVFVPGKDKNKDDAVCSPERPCIILGPDKKVIYHSPEYETPDLDKLNIPK